MNDKANFRKELDRLRDILSLDENTPMIRLINKPFKVEIVHNKSEDGKRTYVNAKLGEATPAFAAKSSGKPDYTKPFTAPANASVHTAPIKFFLFDKPSLVQWSSLFIEGTRMVKDESGKEIEKSKNWLQETIKDADNFEGSPLEAILLNAGSSNPVRSTKAQDAVENKNVVEAKEDKPVVENTTAATSEANLKRIAEIEAIQSNLKLLGMDLPEAVAEELAALKV